MLTDHVDFITKASGGKGVLQETIEFILTEQGKMKTALQRMRKEVYKA
ncbi:MAG: hypothetical protein H8D46_04775 [FCB group bacterium]|nr:hypothetical protein [FCB group bacterium]